VPRELATRGCRGHRGDGGALSELVQLVDLEKVAHRLRRRLWMRGRQEIGEIVNGRHATYPFRPVGLTSTRCKSILTMDAIIHFFHFST
jgi:hypothetical protein